MLTVDGVGVRNAMIEVDSWAIFCRSVQAPICHNVLQPLADVLSQWFMYLFDLRQPYGLPRVSSPGASPQLLDRDRRDFAASEL
jgi:hypothetical protein